jgi:hypothetical protein
MGDLINIPRNYERKVRIRELGASWFPGKREPALQWRVSTSDEPQRGFRVIIRRDGSLMGESRTVMKLQ